MNSLLPSRYALDYTGTSRDNAVEGEIRDIGEAQLRVVVPGAGAYYAESLSILDHSTGEYLKPGLDYVHHYLCALPTMMSAGAQKICAVILIINPRVHRKISLSYQALGDNKTSIYEAIAQQIVRTLSDQRKVIFENILNRPAELEPTLHLHHLGEGIGFEHMVEAIERVRSAILLGDQIDHERILQYVDSSIAVLKAGLSQTRDDLFILAVANAARALKASTEQGAAAATLYTQVESALAEVSRAQLLASVRKDNLDEEVRAAEDLIAAYDVTQVSAASLNLRQQPGQSTLESVLWRPSASTVIGAGFIGLDWEGDTVIGSDLRSLDLSQQSLSMGILAKSIIDPNGRAQVSLSVAVNDERDSLLNGRHASTTIRWLPWMWLEVMGKLQEIGVFSASMRVSRLSNLPDTGSSWGVYPQDTGLVRGFSSDGSDAAASGLIAARTLTDTRRDFNLSNISPYPRGPLVVRLTPGTAWTLDVIMQAKSKEVLETALALPLVHETVLMSGDSGMRTFVGNRPVQVLNLSFLPS